MMPWKKSGIYPNPYDSPEITILGDRGRRDTERDVVPGKEPLQRHGRISCCQILAADSGDGNDPTSVATPCWPMTGSNSAGKLNRRYGTPSVYRRKAIWKRSAIYPEPLGRDSGLAAEPGDIRRCSKGRVMSAISCRPGWFLTWNGLEQRRGERIARLRTLAENGGDVWRYALDCLTKKHSDTVPDLNEQELTRQCRRRRLPYCVYDAEHSCPMPGSEGALHGRWMKDIQNSGYHHIH